MLKDKSKGKPSLLIGVRCSNVKFEARKEDILNHIKKYVTVSKVISYGMDAISDMDVDQVIKTLEDLSVNNTLIILDLTVPTSEDEKDTTVFTSALKRAAVMSGVYDRLLTANVNVLIHDDTTAKRRTVSEKFVFYTDLYYTDTYMSNIPLAGGKVTTLRNSFGATNELI